MSRMPVPMALVAFGCLFLMKGTTPAQEVYFGAPQAAPEWAPQAPCGCAGSCGKTCVRVPDIKKVNHTLYDCKHEDYCVAPCLWQRLFHHACCGRVQTKSILLKKVVTTDCPTTKCVVDQGCGGSGGSTMPRTPALFGEPGRMPPFNAPAPR